jgi:hypothetical protein
VASDGESGGYSSHMKNIQWEFAVIHDDQVNAFVVRGLTGRAGDGRRMSLLPGRPDGVPGFGRG